MNGARLRRRTLHRLPILAVAALCLSLSTGCARKDAAADRTAGHGGIAGPCKEIADKLQRAQKALDPLGTIATYWARVGLRDYEGAWDLLTEEFKSNNHEGNFAKFRSGFEAMNLCDVSVNLLEGRGDPSSGSTRVITGLVFEAGSSCAASLEHFTIRVISSNGSHPWLIDHVSQEVDWHGD